jgi:hypothetical protein
MVFYAETKQGLKNMCKKPRETCSGQSTKWGVIRVLPRKHVQEDKKKNLRTELDGP